MEISSKELEHPTFIKALFDLEDNMLLVIAKRLKPFADDVEVENIGSVTAAFKGRDEQ